jgi:hypothetical protein
VQNQQSLRHFGKPNSEALPLQTKKVSLQVVSWHSLQPQHVTRLPLFVHLSHIALFNVIISSDLLMVLQRAIVPRWHIILALKQYTCSNDGTSAMLLPCHQGCQHTYGDTKLSYVVWRLVSCESQLHRLCMPSCHGMKFIQMPLTAWCSTLLTHSTRHTVSLQSTVIDTYTINMFRCFSRGAFA